MVYADSLPASPSSGGPLTSSQIAQAVLGPEAPSSLYLSYLNISEIPDNAVQQLAQLRSVDDDENDGTILRIALSNNYLRTLPASFNLLWRLRYLNLRSNALHQFPEVLSNMESLEILDLSRNKIRSFPSSPGTLIRIRVLHLGRNQIGALPTYFPNFVELNLLKIEHNPIEWPPRHILNVAPNTTDPLVASRWVKSIQGWIRDHLARYGRPSMDERRGDPQPGGQSSRTPVHDRTASNESVSSQYSNTSQSSVPDSPRDYRLAHRRIPPDAADGYSSSDRSASVDGHGVLASVHSRNASYTFAQRQNGNPSSLHTKKSLPDMRTRNPDRKPKERPPLPLDSSALSHQPQRNGFSKGSVSDTDHTIRRNAPKTTPRDDEEVETPQPPPMDGERNSYFRRMSTLPVAAISKAVPECLLVTIDAARGILFALSQVYSAVRHYIVFAINDRLSSVLNKVLDPASQYLAHLITALDRFDSLCQNGAPSPIACRGVLESCRDNVTVFRKVVGVLQFQLKVLAGSEDLRYTRTLLMMVYGSMAELSNSWHAMSPHIDEVQSLVRDSHLQSLSPPMPLNLPKTTRPSHQTIPENGEAIIPERAETPSTAGRVPPFPVNRPRIPSSSERRRQGGSFSVNDVRKGREMPIVQPGFVQPGSVQPLVIKPPSAASKALRNHLRQGPGAASPRLNQYGFSLHSPSLSNSSHSHGSSAGNTREGDFGQVSNTNGGSHAALISNKDKFVDASTLNAMEESTDLALSVWKQVEDLFETAGEGLVIGRDYLMRAREVTMSLRSNIRAVLEGADGDVYGAALWEGANTFSKDVANVLLFVKKTCTERRIPLDAALRADLQKLGNSTQEFVTFLAFSSFAVGKPPPSPAPSYDERIATPTSAHMMGSSSDLTPPSGPLWRSRSANVMGSPPGQSPALGRGAGSTNGGAIYQHALAGGSREQMQWSGPAHPSLQGFRMPPSPAPSSRMRHGGGIVGYKDSD